MRVLVISLLRLGDFIQILPVLNALKMQLNVRELDLLTFDPVQQMAPMVEGVNKWWTLDRDNLQKGLRHADIPLLTSFNVLKEKLDQVNGRNYDLVINLTQTHFSGWVAGYINSPQRTGLVIDAKGTALFHSSWFQYLDDHAIPNVKDIFNYTDIFFYGCGLKGSERQWRLKETARGVSEIAALNLDGSENIVVQLFTSDSKKTWSEQSWLSTLTQLQLFRPNVRFTLLGAPNEESRLNSLLEKAEARGVRVQKAILSLEGALSLLKKSQLLISADTSIKHLANAVEIPVLELSLGSSDLRRTGSYKNDSLILQAQVACAPCPHSSPCSQATHLCAKMISADVVSTTAHHFMSSNWLAIKELASEYSNEVQFFRTKMMSTGFWMANDVIENSPERVVETLVERCTWKFLLNREHLDPLAKFGSEGVQLRRELEEIFPDHGSDVFHSHLNFLEQEADATNQKAATLLTTVQSRSPAIDDIQEFISNHQPASSTLPWLERLREQAKGGVVEIGSLRRVHNHLEKYFYKSQVKAKLIRSLKSQLTESK